MDLIEYVDDLVGRLHHTDQPIIDLHGDKSIPAAVTIIVIAAIVVIMDHDHPIAITIARNIPLVHDHITVAVDVIV